MACYIWKDERNTECMIRDGVCEDMRGLLIFHAKISGTYEGGYLSPGAEDWLYKALRKRRKKKEPKKKPSKPTRLLREFVEATAAHRISFFATDHDMTQMGHGDNNWLWYYRTIAREVLERIDNKK